MAAGDAAPLSLIELVTLSAEEEKKKSAVEKAKEVLKKVSLQKEGTAKNRKKEDREKKDRKGEERGKRNQEGKEEKKR